MLTIKLSKTWMIGKTVEGYIYYYNHITKKSQWHYPETVEIQEKNKWTNGRTIDDIPYYYNTYTKKSQYELP